MPDLHDLKQFNFSFDSDLDALEFGEPTSMDEVADADPGVFLPNDEGRSEFLPPDPDRMPTIPDAVDQSAPDYAARPAEERVRELLAYMSPHRHVLLGVLRATLEPCSDERLHEVIDELRAHKFSVYSAANICTMLEKAGALERVTPDGAPYASYVPQPRIVVVDGVEFYEATEAPCVHWVTSQAGKDALEANDPLDRITRQLERESEFAVLYKRVLLLAARDTGVTMAQLSGAVDAEPLIAQPRRFFVQHFVESLERCECMAWQGSTWKITPLGTRVLNDMLAEVDDDFTYEEDPAAPARIATETQGVSW